MKLVKIILVCLVFDAPVFAVTYSSYHATHTTAEAPQTAFRSTSAVPVTYYTVKALNEDGTVSSAYTTYGKNNTPRYVGRGLDLDDDDEPTGGLVPVGDTPCFFIVLLLAVYLGSKKLLYLCCRS